MTIATIDLGYLGIPEAAAAFLLDLGAPVLVECGSARTLPALESGLAGHGLRLADLAALVVTHVHLDHAGAAGHLAAARVPVYVHPLGARHLVDPTRLTASSRRVHGERFDRHYGDPIPAPAELVRSVELDATIAFPRGTLKAIATPGHAKHHLAWLLEEPDGRILFAGDVAAMIAPGSRPATVDGRGLLSLPTPPPDFDREAWRGSLRRLRELRVDRLLLTHFGDAGEPDRHLAEVEDRLEREVDAMCRILSALPPAERASGYRSWLEAEARRIGADCSALSPTARSTFLGSALVEMNLAGVGLWIERGG